MARTLQKNEAILQELRFCTYKITQILSQMTLLQTRILEDQEHFGGWEISTRTVEMFRNMVPREGILTAQSEALCILAQTMCSYIQRAARIRTNLQRQ